MTWASRDQTIKKFWNILTNTSDNLNMDKFTSYFKTLRIDMN